MPTTEGYNGTFTGPQIDEAIAKTKNAITVSNGGELDMAENLGDGPYVIEFTEETSSGGSGGMTEEEADARYLKLAGGTMTGPITGIVTPTADDMPVPKKYLDDMIGNINSILDVINGEVI